MMVVMVVMVLVEVVVVVMLVMVGNLVLQLLFMFCAPLRVLF